MSMLPDRPNAAEGLRPPLIDCCDLGQDVLAVPGLNPAMLDADILGRAVADGRLVVTIQHRRLKTTLLKSHEVAALLMRQGSQEIQ